MALNVGTLAATIDVDDHGLDRTLRKAESRWDRFAARMTRVSRTAGLKTQDALSVAGIDGDAKQHLSKFVNAVDKAGKRAGKVLGEGVAEGVVANIDKAEARVKKFGRTLEQAKTREAEATDRVGLAEAQLDDLRKKSNVSATKMLAAENKLTAARNRAAEAKTARTEIEVDKGKAEAELAAFKREAEQLVAKVRVDADMSPARRAVLDLGRKTRARIAVDADTGHARAQIADLGRAMLTVTGKSAKWGAITGLGIAALSSVQGVSALTAALAPLAGGLAGLPVIVASAGVAFGALKVGLSGFSDAMKNMDDPEKFSEAIAGMAPAARQTAVAIRGLKPAWETVTRSVQGALFAGIGAELTRTARAVLPALRASLTSTAAGWNIFGKASLRAVREQFVTSGLLEGLGNNMRGFLEQAAGAVQPLLSAVSVLTGALMDRLPGAGKSLTDLALRFETFILDANDAGKITDWVDGAKTAFKNLASIVGSLGRILGGIGKAATSAGSGLTPFATGLKGIADTVNSGPFQTGLSGFFTGISVGMRGLMSALPAVSQLFSVLGPILGQIAAQAGPMLGQALRIVAQALSALLPSLQPLITGLMAGLRPVLAAVGPLLMQMAVALRPLGPALGQIAAALGGAFAVALRAVTPLLVLTATALASTFTWLARNRPVLYGLIGAYAAYKAIMLATTVASAAYNVLLPFMTAGTMRYTIAQRLLNMSMLGFPLVWILAALVAVGVGLTVLWKKSATFRAIVTGAWNGVKAAVGVVVRWFQVTVWPVLRAVLGWIGSKIMWLYRNVVAPYFAAIRTVVGAVVGFFRTSVWPWMSKVLGWIGAKIAWLYKSGFKIYVGFIRAVVGGLYRWLRDTVWPSISRTFGWIGGKASWLYRSGIKPPFDWITSKIGSVYRWIRDTVYPSIRKSFGWIGDKASWLYKHGIKPAMDKFKSALSGVKKVAETTKDGIGKAWDKLRGLVKKPINAVIGFINKPLISGVNGLIPGKGPLKYLTKLAAGGPVPGWSPNDTADNIPAMLTADEEVIRRVSARRMRRENPGWLEHVNEHGRPPMQYAHGGRAGTYVGSVPSVPAVAGYAGGGSIKGRILRAARGAQKLGWLVQEFAQWGTNHPRFHMRGSDHNTGLAFDANWPGESGNNTPGERRNWPRLRAYLKGLGLGAIYGNKADHLNHVHVMPPGRPYDAVRSGATFSGSGDAGFSFDPMSLLSDLKGKVSGGIKSLLGKFGNAWPIKMATSVGKKGISGLWKNAASRLQAAWDSGALSSVPGMGWVGGVKSLWDKIKGSGGNAQKAVQRAFAQWGWDKGPNWSATKWLVGKESSWNPKIKNPRSTAYGLFQFLNKTWATVGGRKTSDPYLQGVYGGRYIKQRYKNPLGAMAFWRRHHWYGDGGRAGTGSKRAPAVQRLGIHQGTYDNGGRLKPGYTLAYNGTRRNETIRTGKQEDRLLSTLQALADQQAAGVIGEQRRVTLQLELDGRQLEAAVTARQDSQSSRGTSEPGVEVLL